MPHTTLTVPAKYAEDFRAALAYEIGFDAKCVQDERKAVLTAIEERRENVAARNEDLRSNMRLLHRDAELFAEVGLAGTEGDIEIRGADLETLAHVCETMARRVIGPHLADQLDIGPMDSKQGGELRKLIEPLTWAIERAGELHTRYWEERRAEEAA